MRLTPEQYHRWSDVIRDAFDYATLQQTLVTRLGKRIEDISIGGDLREVVFKLLSVADQEGWLSPLAHALAEERPNRADIAALRDETTAIQATVPADPFQTPVIRGNRPFVDRDHLRNALVGLNDPLGGRVLLVTGPPVSGKTYSAQLIGFLRDRLGSYKTVVIDLKEDADANYGPGDLAASIARQMGIDVDGMPPPDGLSPNRWPRALRDWLIGELHRSGDVWWLVLDGVREEVLPHDTLEFIGDMVKQAQENLPELRVVLLDGTVDVVPPYLLPAIEHERIDRIGRTEIVRWVDDQFARRGEEADPEAVNEVVEFVLGSAPEEPRARMHHITYALGRAVRELFQDAG